uniref:Uncharacterized protein n=1 Tax=Rhizophora mucronata TaxID=61149 RepID=A0A2P2PHG4_RHIMU
MYTTLQISYTLTLCLLYNMTQQACFFLFLKMGFLLLVRITSFYYY